MLLCQIEMRALEDAEHAPAYYIVGRYGFEPDLQEGDDLWINWQIADHNFEIKTRVTSRKKEVYADGKGVLLNMSDTERRKLSALYADGINSLLEGASLFLVRIFVEATDTDALLKIREAMSKKAKMLGDVKRLPDAYEHSGES